MYVLWNQVNSRIKACYSKLILGQLTNNKVEWSSAYKRRNQKVRLLMQLKIVIKRQEMH